MNVTSFINSLSSAQVRLGQDKSDIDQIISQIRRWAPYIEHLQETHTEHELTSFLAESDGRQIAAALLGVKPKSLRDFGNNIDSDLFSLVQALGTFSQNRLDAVLTGVLLSNKTRMTNSQRTARVERIVGDNLKQVLSTNEDVSLTERSGAEGLKLQDITDNYPYSYIIYKKGTPVVLVVVKVVYHETKNTRQIRDMRLLLEMQQALEQENISLLAVLDGPGFTNPAIRSYLDQVSNLTNLEGLSQAETVNQSIEYAYRLQQSGVIERDEKHLIAIAEQELRIGGVVTPQLLRLSEERAIEFITRFQALHPKYELETDSRDSLRSTYADLLRYTGSIINDIRKNVLEAPDLLVKVVAEKLDYGLRFNETRLNYSIYFLEVRDSQLNLVDQGLPVVVLAHLDRRRYQDVLRELDNTMLRLVLLIDPLRADETRSAMRDIGVTRIQFALIDNYDVEELLLRKTFDARSYLLEKLINQVDKSVLSPFVERGPTPKRMFFGREPELRLITEQIGYQSFALIGGRKSGKTSILRNLQRLLPERGHPIEYFDCQAIHDRAVFLEEIQHRTKGSSLNLDGSQEGQPERVIRAFLQARFGDQTGVLLMDEVDALFLSDREEKNSPHLLSLALRAISQSGAAKMVVVGERGLFALIHDASSPHWNFCTPLYIRPLQKAAAEDLLRNPLEELRIAISSNALHIAMERTACHPNLLQQLGKQIVDSYSQKAQSSDVDEETIKTLTQKIAFRDEVTATFWSQSKAEEKLMTFMLDKETPKSWRDIQPVFNAHGKKLSATQITRCLEYLELYAVAQRKNEGFVYAEPIFEQYYGSMAEDLQDELWEKIK